jgi:hypothetical protein
MLYGLEAPAVVAAVAAVAVEVMAVEPHIPAIALRFEVAAIAPVPGEVVPIVTHVHAVMADITTVGEGRLGLGSYSGKQEADGEHYGEFRFHTSSFKLW